FVVDDQNCRYAVALHLSPRLLYWNVNVKCRALAGLAVEIDGSLMCIHNNVAAERKSDSRPLAKRLRRKTGFENPVPMLRKNSAARVLNVDSHVGRLWVRSYSDRSFFRNGLRRVHHQVQKHLSQQRRKTLHLRHLLELSLKSDPP